MTGRIRTVETHAEHTWVIAEDWADAWQLIAATVRETAPAAAPGADPVAWLVAVVTCETADIPDLHPLAEQLPDGVIVNARHDKPGPSDDTASRYRPSPCVALMLVLEPGLKAALGNLTRPHPSWTVAIVPPGTSWAAHELALTLLIDSELTGGDLTISAARAAAARIEDDGC